MKGTEVCSTKGVERIWMVFLYWLFSNVLWEKGEQQVFAYPH